MLYLGEMEISWLGHSCFRIKGTNSIIITDPYSPDSGYSLNKPAANIVTISHRHPDHSHIEDITGEPKVISGPGEYEINNILIIGLATFHDGEGGKKLGKNTVYLMEVDGILVCHLGDLGHVLTNQQVEEMGKVDVLLLPVGGDTTIDAPMAAEVVRQLEPKVVVPMHYQTEAGKQTLEPVDKFLKEVGVKDINPQNKLTFTRASLPISTQVYLLTC